MKVLFIGTPDFAVESLDALINAGYTIVGVVTAPDKPKGRGMKPKMSDVKQYALKKGIKVFQPEKIKGNQAFLDEIKTLNADIACCVVYGKILPKEFLDLFKYGVVNVHPSLLPKYRGAAPIQWAIINGETETGVCTMYLKEGMDDGDIILKEKEPIYEDETAGELWDRLSKVGSNLLVKSLDLIKEGKVKAKRQGNNFTLAPKIEKSFSKIDWENKTALEIKNLIRALNPSMGAYSYLNDMRIKFWKADVIAADDFINSHEEFKEYKNRVLGIDSGTIIYVSEKEGLFIKTNKDILSILELQAENGKWMDIASFLRGNEIMAGMKFE